MDRQDINHSDSPTILSDEDVTRAQAAIKATFARPDSDGVAVVDGFGCALVVDRGHLTALDGLGECRRRRCWPRAGHGLKRVVIAGKGKITSEALKWTRDVGVEVLVLDAWQMQTLMVTATEPARDGRLRRAQAVAGLGEPGLILARELIVAKLRGQAAVAHSRLQAPDVADALEGLADESTASRTVEMVRRLEAEGAARYWEAWTGRPMTFVRKDRVPAGWRAFGSRRSRVQPSGPRYASDPTGAILNLLYRLLEVEARFACLTMGLDPLLGVLHVDDRDRDALTLDLIEPVRPVVDVWVLDLLDGHTFAKTDFAESRTGVVSVLAPLSHALCETMPRWGAELAPWAERAASVFAEASPYLIPVPTRLTQRNRRTKTQPPSSPATKKGPAALRVARGCAECGTPTVGRRALCDGCVTVAKARSAAKAQERSRLSRERRKAAGEQQPTWAPEVNQSRVEKMRRQKALRDAWEAAHADEVWEQADFEPIRLALADVPISALMRVTGLSRGACTALRTGRMACHPRHWAALAELAGMAWPSQLGDNLNTKTGAYSDRQASFGDG
jgi:CRISPR-associated endonuclease Cas1